MTDNTPDCTCINCKIDFKSYKTITRCQHCDNGIAENHSDMGYIGTHYIMCRICKGKGEIEETEWCFCSEDCLEDKLYEL